MDLRLGLSVIYTDANGSAAPAFIAAINDDSGNVDLIVFVSEAAGFRNDQTGINYAESPTANAWSNI